jgi:hypothetical protein
MGNCLPRMWISAMAGAAMMTFLLCGTAALWLLGITVLIFALCRAAGRH